MKYEKSRLRETVSVITIQKFNDFSKIDLQFFFDYKIFPSEIMSFYTEWGGEKRKMKVGDTIVQQVYIPPIRSFSQKIIFGVRINEIINDPNRLGFSYETLEGHVEKGVSTFTIEKEGTGLIFKIQTFSAPGNILSKILGPVFSLPYQRYCTKKALRNVKTQFINN